MVLNNSDFKKHFKYIQNQMKIPIEPGFQHNPSFIAYENYFASIGNPIPTGEIISQVIANDPNLNNHKKIKEQKSIIEKLVEKVDSTIRDNERQRLCLDISLNVSSMLENLGIWSYVYQGSLIYQADDLKENKVLDYLDSLAINKQGARGHAWIYTKHFPVIDLTAKFQGISNELKELVPSIVMIDENSINEIPKNNDYIMDNDSYLTRRSKTKILNKVFPDLNIWNQQHFTKEFNTPNLKLRYVPMEVGFLDKPITQANNFVKIGGIKSKDFFYEFKKELK